MHRRREFVHKRQSSAQQTPLCREREYWYDIDGISRRLAPLWGDGSEERQGAGWLDGHRGLDMDQICISGQSSQGEVIAVREKRIEGSERTGAGVLVTCRRVDLKPQTGAPVRIGECEATDCSQRPGAGRFSADASSLDHCLEVPIPPTVVAGIMDIEDVAPFAAAGKEKMRIVEIVTRIIGTKVSWPDVSPLDSEPAILEMAIGVVVEDTLGDVYDRLTPEADDAPRVLLPIEPSRIVRLAHIGTVPDGDETLQVEGHLLAPHADLHFAFRQASRIGDEALRKVERVPVRRSDYRFPGRVVVLELYEDLPVLVGPDIGVNILTIQQIVLNGDPADAESSCVECFEALAQIEAERHIALRIIRRQWDVFQIVKRLGS